MSALDDYRRFSLTISGFKTTHEARVVAGGFDEFRLYADKAIAELEAHVDRYDKALCEAEAALAEAKARDVDAIPHMCQATVFLRPAAAELAERDRAIARLTVDCDEYVFSRDGRCYHYEDRAVCPREPGCHDKDRARAEEGGGT